MTFEEWWNDQNKGAPTMVFDTDEQMAKAAFLAGQASTKGTVSDAASSRPT